MREAVERFCSKIVAALDASIAAIPATEPAGSGRAAALDAQPANEAKEAQRQAEKQRKEREEREMQERTRTEEIRSQQEARRAAEERAAREAERTRQQEAARNAEAERQRQDAARAAERKRNAAQASAQAAEKDAAVAMPATSAPGAGEPSILQRAFAHPIVRGAAMPLLVLLAWEVAAATGAISTLFLPSPTGVLAEWFRRVLSGELLIATATTLTRLAGGVMIGFALALAFSRLFVNLPRLRDFTLPLLRFLHAIPPVSYLPLLIIPFGSGPIVGIAATAIAAFFVLLLHSEGEEAPGAAAQVLPTLRLGIGLTVIFCVTLASELLTESGGLGHVAAVSEQQMNAAGIFSSILTAAFVVLAIHFVTRTRIAQTSWVGLVRQQASMPRDSKPPPRSLIWRAAEIAAVPVVLILSWQILASLRGDPLVLPGPVEVISTNSAELMGNAAITVTQLLAAFSLGVLPALLLSKLMQARPPLAGVLLPFLRACTNVPGVLLLPVAVLWFGLGNASAIFAAACGTFFPVVMELVERRSLSAAVLAGLRLAFLLVIAGELFLGNGGLGYLMMRGVGVLNMPLLSAPILAAGIIGLLLEGSARLTLSRIART